MMLRAIIFVVIALLIAFGASWLSAQEGVTTITWLGYRAEIDSSLLVVAIIGFTLVVVLADRLVRAVFRLPYMLSSGWQERRRIKGEMALSLGFVALAAGDNRAAHKQARRAEKLLEKGILTDLLVAQSSSARGDAKAASRYFKKLAAAPETAYFGQLGLMRLYQQDNGATQTKQISKDAYQAAQKAFALDATSAEAAQLILRKALEDRDWAKAIECLTVYLNHSGGQSPSEVNKAKALYARLSLQRAMQIVEQHKDDSDGGARAALKQAMSFCEDALAQTPDFAPASAYFVELALQIGNKKLAQKQAKSCFLKAPFYDNLQSLRAAADDNDGKFISDAMRLAKQSERPDDGYLAVALFAISVGIWASASQVLSHISDVYPRHNHYWRVKAAIAAGLEDDEAHHAALQQAADAPRAASWHCAQCGHSAPHYTFDCQSCQSPGQMDFVPVNSAPN